MMNETQKLLWVDLEMTGLDPQQDRILEVAAIITDWQFKEYATFDQAVGQDQPTIQKLLDANGWYTERPQNKEAMLHLAATGDAEEQVVGSLLELIDLHFAADEKVILAGNSIHQDRRFIRQWWPQLEQRLHYRMLDVSAWKVVMEGRFGEKFTKTESHRALQDIRESIAELQYYLHYFGKDNA